MRSVIPLVSGSVLSLVLAALPVAVAVQEMSKLGHIGHTDLDVDTTSACPPHVGGINVNTHSSLNLCGGLLFSVRPNI